VFSFPGKYYGRESFECLLLVFFFFFSSAVFAVCISYLRQKAKGSSKNSMKAKGVEALIFAAAAAVCDFLSWVSSP
jgi:hypothetical protein